MTRFIVPVLCLALAACGAANQPQAANDVPETPKEDFAPPANNVPEERPPANEGRRKFEVPEGLPLPQADETPLYKLIAREYFAALGKFDLAGLRRTLSQRVQDSAGAQLPADINAMREHYARITFEEVSWQADGDNWICTFHQTLYPKKGEPEIERDQKIYLVKERGFWRVEQ